MTPIGLVVLLLLTAVGLRWAWLVVPAWFASVGWIAATGSGWWAVAWGLLVYPLVLLVVSRRNRIHPRDDANGHLKNEPGEGSEDLTRLRRPSTYGRPGGGGATGGGVTGGLGAGPSGGGGGTFGGGGASGGW